MPKPDKYKKYPYIILEIIWVWDLIYSQESEDSVAGLEVNHSSDNNSN